jgi:antitoxin (DNA-binding transcriptional repressor) of toxin-antitoxin stability system
MTRLFDVSEVQGSLTEVLSLVAAGNEVVLTRDNTPVACVVPVKPSPQSRTPGLHPGAMQPSADFDEPLPEAFWTAQA